MQLFILERQREAVDNAIAAGELDATVEPAGEIVLKGMGPTKVCVILPVVRAGSGKAVHGDTVMRSRVSNIDRVQMTAMPTMAERVTMISFTGAKVRTVGVRRGSGKVGERWGALRGAC